MSPSETIPKSRLDEIVARLRHVNSRRCPFDDPGFRMDPLKPCPACGDVGDGPGVDAPSKCVSSNYLVLHAEAADAIEELTKERDEARETNRDFHRRLQFAERFRRSKADTRAILWKFIGKHIGARIDAEHKTKAAESSLASVTAERDALREEVAATAGRYARLAEESPDRVEDYAHDLPAFVRAGARRG